MVNGVDVFEPLCRHERKDVFQQVVDAGEDKTAFFIGDLNEVVRNFAHFKKLLPRARPYFDVALNDTDYVLQALAELGINFSCQNKFEISKVVDAIARSSSSNGVNDAAVDVLLDGTSKVASHLRHASENGVSLLVCESVQAIKKVHGAAPNSRLLLKLDARVEFVEAHWKALFDEATSLGLTVVGLSVEGIFGANDRNGYTAAQRQQRSTNDRRKASALARLVFELGLECGQECMTLIDVGRVGNKNFLDAELCEFLEGDLLAQFENYGADGEEDFEVVVMCHPGEFLLSSAVSLAVKVIEKRVAFRNDGAKHCSYVVGESVFESFGGLTYYGAAEEEQHHLQGIGGGFTFQDVESLVGNSYYGEDVFHDDGDGGVSMEEAVTTTTSCDIYGESGDDGDVISKGVLVNEVNVGDWLIFPHMGCYAMNCSFERPVGSSFPIKARPSSSSSSRRHLASRGSSAVGSNLWYHVKSGIDDEAVLPPFSNQVTESSSDFVEDAFGDLMMMMSLSEDSVAGSVAEYMDDDDEDHDDDSPKTNSGFRPFDDDNFGNNDVWFR